MVSIVKAMPTLVPRLVDPVIVPGGGNRLPQALPDIVKRGIVDVARNLLVRAGS